MDKGHGNGRPVSPTLHPGWAEHARRAAELAGDLLCTAAPDGIYRWVNPAWERTLGWSVEELTSRPFAEFVHPEDVERTAAATARVAEQHHELVDFRNRYRHRDGGWRWLEWRAYTDGNLWYGCARDVTDSRRGAETMRLQAMLLDQVDAAVVAADLAGNVTEWNAAAEQLYGWAREEVMGRSLRALLVAPEDEGLADTINSEVMRHGTWEGELWLCRRDGTRLLVLSRNAVIRDEHGEATGIAGVSVDITRRRDEERRLRSAQSFLAAVTEHVAEGLFCVDPEGRLTFMNPAAERMFGRTQQELKGKLMHDATHHTRPDGSAYPVAECPMLRTRTDGVLVREDNDYFVRADGSLFPVSYSSAPFVTDEGVRGTVVVFSDASERQARDQEMRRNLEALTWVGRIRDALDRDRFLLYAQPIIDLASNRIVRHELLLRMLGDDGEIVLPGRFLPVAESYGLIGEIDRWVIDASIRLATRGNSIQLNVSGESMADPDIFRRIESRLREEGVAPGKLVVEITETALITNEIGARQFAERLERIGCGLALDDFGTGYGGFTYLKQLPVRYLKIDREFVGDLAENPASRHVVEAIVRLAEGFGLRTVAEGVEDEGAMATLREIGVDYAQGFLISRPYPAEEMYADPRVVVLDES